MRRTNPNTKKMTSSEPTTTESHVSIADQHGYYDNVTRMSYLTGNDSILDHAPALVIDMTDYKHYLEGKLGLKIFFCALISFSGIMGTLGNILIILAVLTEKFLRHPGNVFIINLAIADLFVTTFIDAFNIVGAIYGHHFYNGQQWMCELVAALCAPACAASMASICAVAINRFVRICHFDKYSAIFTWRSCILLCFGIWVYAFCVHLPNHVGWGIGDYDNSYFICTFSIATYSYAVFYISVAVCCPLCVLSYAYVKIYLRFHESRNRMAAHTGVVHVPAIRTNAVAPSSAATSTKTDTADKNTAGGAALPKIHVHSHKEDAEKQLIKTLFLVAAFFVGCWAPFSLFVLMGQPKFIPGWLYVISIIMAHGNSSLNWILYGITSSAFRDGYRSVMGKIWTLLCGARIASSCWCSPHSHGGGSSTHNNNNNSKRGVGGPTTIGTGGNTLKAGRPHIVVGSGSTMGNNNTKEEEAADNMDLRAFV